MFAKSNAVYMYVLNETISEENANGITVAFSTRDKHHVSAKGNLSVQ